MQLNISTRPSDDIRWFPIQRTTPNVRSSFKQLKVCRVRKAQQTQRGETALERTDLRELQKQNKSKHAKQTAAAHR